MKLIAWFGIPILAAGFAFANAAPPAPAIPATPAGRVLSAFLTAFNSGNRDRMRKFMLQYEPSNLKRLDDDMGLRAMTGGFDLREIETSAASVLTALVQERDSDNFARLTLRIETLPERHVAIGLELTQRPPEFALPHLSQTQLLDALQQRLQSQTAAGTFSGAVLVAKDGKSVFERAYGLANRAQKLPNTVDTRFRIGSMNKMFTAVAVMQLVQAGKISLDAPLGTYLPAYPNRTLSSGVTIRELLTHTGGTGDIFGPAFDKNRLRLRTLGDYIDLYGSRPAEFKPGSRWEYSNYGFILLGAVIEKVSGQSYYDYVQEHIYAPAGMTSTGSLPENAEVPNRSVGYTQTQNGSLQPNTGTLPYRGTSAGGGYSTVGDLLRFANALEEHELLSAQYTEMTTSGKVATPGGGSYGFGFGESVINGTRCFGHNGGAPGMNGDLEICPASGYVVAVLSNLDPPAAGRISDFITNRLPSK